MSTFLSFFTPGQVVMPCDNLDLLPAGTGFAGSSQAQSLSSILICSCRRLSTATQAAAIPRTTCGSRIALAASPIVPRVMATVPL
jgi:hypothetical protein